RRCRRNPIGEAADMTLTANPGTSMDRPAPGATPAPRPTRWALVKLIVAMTVVAGVALFALRDDDPVFRSVAIPFAVMVCAFAAWELMFVSVPTRRDRHAVALSNIPCVVGLFFCAPVALVTAQIVGTGAALIGRDRQKGVKLLFNVAQIAIMSLVAIVVFRS